MSDAVEAAVVAERDEAGRVDALNALTPVPAFTFRWQRS